MIWGVIDQVIRLQSSSDIATAKGIGLYGLSALDSLGRARAGSDSQGNELLGPLMRALEPILSQDSGLLARHVDLVGDLLTWPDGSDFLHALALDRSPVRANAANLVLDAVSDTQRGLDLMAMLGALDASPQAHQSWDDFRDRWKALDGVPEYRALRLSELGRELLFFLEARTSDGKAPLPADQAALTRKLLLTTATLLERGDMQLVDQLLAFARRDPDGFYRVIESLGGLVEQGDVQALLDLIDSKLGPAT